MTRKIIFIVSLILAFVSVTAFADDAERQLQRLHDNTLRGLNGVYGLVEYLRPDMQEHGLTEDQIRTFQFFRNSQDISKKGVGIHNVVIISI